MSIEAMKQALEALEAMQNAIYNIGGEHVIDLDCAVEKADVAQEAITSLRQAIATEEDNYQGSDAAKAAHMMDLYTALGIKWGEDPFAVIAKMREAATEESSNAANAAATQEPVAGVVIREGNPTLLRDKDIKPTDKRLYTHPQQKAEQEPKQKAVGVVLGSYGEPSLDVRLYAELPAGTELWPDAQVQQKPKREPMTDEQVEDIYQSHSGYGGDDFWSFARAIEAAHGIYAPLKGEA